jgi:triosephosphate isomerase (TIM)
MSKLIVANWKSHKSREAVEKWMDEFEKSSAKISSEIEVVLAPAMPSLMFVSNCLLDRKDHPQTRLAVQDLSPFPPGAYTGAVSTENLEGFKVHYALLGHSERRRYFAETSQDVANKVDQAIQAGIKPIVCVDKDYIRSQAAAIGDELLSKVVVAYEPLEAIGSGLEEPIETVTKIVGEIRKVFGQVPVIYGGSVSAANIAAYLEVTDGALVATHSLDADDFKRVLTAAGT